jgi:hypothetical protein
MVAVYVAAFAPTIAPAAVNEPPPHKLDPPAYGGGLVTVPVMVLLPELIVNGIDIVSSLKIIWGFTCTETETLAFASLNVPG